MHQPTRANTCAARSNEAGIGLAIAWQQDDILSTRLTGPFDLIFDRGCFHVLPPEQRRNYAATVTGLLKPGGYLFLKCFSTLQPGAQGPHRCAPEQIDAILKMVAHKKYESANVIELTELALAQT